MNFDIITSTINTQLGNKCHVFFCLLDFNSLVSKVWHG